jgi:hypothetical protein
LFAVARSQWSRFHDQTFVDRPNLVAFHRRLAVGGPTGLVKRLVFDIVANAVQVRPGPAGATVDAFAARMEQGVVDSNLESLLAREDAGVVSASDLYRRSATQGVRWVTLRPGEGGKQPDWGDVKLPEKERALVARDLAAGQVVVVPTRAVEVNGRPEVGWWRVDPKTGQTLGMTEAGGSSATEYSMLARVMIAVSVGGATFIGCGGAAPGAGGMKMLGCAVCAAVAAALVMIAFAGAAAGAGATGLTGFMAGGHGVASGAGITIVCSFVSALM